MWNNALALTRIANTALLLAIALLLAAVLWRIANNQVFSVSGIDVVGNVAHVTREQVRTIAVNELRGTFFTVDLRGTQTAFEKLPWVRRVVVRRRWPNRLEVVVEEHRELARWGNSALVNHHGEMFEGAINKRLPVFEGPTGSQSDIARNYRRFNQSLALIGRKVTRVQVSDRRAWRLDLDDGMVIELGRDGVVERLEGFVTAYAHSVGELRGKTDYVDLRYSNGFAVRVREDKWSEARA
ncbi:MAG: cell division protein FtsQ/DivIB [Betaproteobacteria bacterium]|nr:MAG: cell division protein FtsQ/DivIB [Betaproteobacteria bacterium]